MKYNEYVPDGPIWLMFGLGFVLGMEAPYIIWSPNKERAKESRKWHNKHYSPKLDKPQVWVQTDVKDKESLWLMFDMSNGHPESYAYVWYFKSKEVALVFRKYHNTLEHHTPLSYPHPWKRLEQ
jgi:hypothetical protein